MMIDPELKYCVRCDDEYLRHIEKCGVCGDALVSGAELLVRKKEQRQFIESRRGELTGQDDVVTLFKAPLGEIKRLELQLNNQNIGTLVVGDGPACGKGCCGGGNAELLVRREDFADAMVLVNEDFERMTALTDHNQAFAEHTIEPGSVVCPACGFTLAATADTCPDCGLCFG